MARSWPDGPAAAVTAALAPYAWREFTDSMLARRAVGAVDRYAVDRMIAGLPGVEAGAYAAPGPVDADDARVEALVWALDGLQWRGWALARLSADLVDALESWQEQRESLASDLRRLLDD